MPSSHSHSHRKIPTHQTNARPSACTSHPTSQRHRTTHTTVCPGPALPLSTNGMPPGDWQPIGPWPRTPSVKDMRLLQEYR